jgi:serine protease Do
VIIDEEGYILTNDHVVRRADKIAVKLANGTNVYEAKLIASDSRKDVALLKINPKPGEKFTAIKFAADDDLLLGETVMALGNPFNLGGSVSRGILSSKSRVEAGPEDQLREFNCLQTDASINVGNSGGPLINLRGELIGLNTIIWDIVQGHIARGIGFAIPVKQVTEALAGMFTPESQKSLWFGARVKAASGPLMITAVQLDSPADKAGLRPGDTILMVNGVVPKGFMDFKEKLINSDKPEVAISTLRRSERRDTVVRLVLESSFFNADFIQQKLGVSLQEVTPQLAETFGLNASNGFIVAGVEPGSPAAGMLKRGYLVTAIEGQTPVDITAAAKLLYPKNKGDTAHLRVMVQQRQGNFMQYQQGDVEVPVR